jgi:biopolymer transport protein ExbD
MPSRAVKEMRGDYDEWEFELPISMIDVVFLLLIFFLLASKFRSIERRLDADLPKDEGQNPVPKKIELPQEIRVKIYWANSNPTRQWPYGQVIHSPSAPFPTDWPGRIVPLSTAGHHIVIQVGKAKVNDLNDLARTLADLAVAQPDMPVVIDARQAVPFRWIVGAVDACKRARVKEIKFQAAPVEGGGGDDWWWM